MTKGRTVRFTKRELAAQAARRLENARRTQERIDRRERVRANEQKRFLAIETRARNREIKLLAKAAKKFGLKIPLPKKITNIFARGVSRAIKAALPQIKTLAATERAKRTHSNAPLSIREQHRVRSALFGAIDAGKVQDYSEGKATFLFNRPALARQWIDYYEYGIGDEPDDLPEMEAFYGKV